MDLKRLNMAKDQAIDADNVFELNLFHRLISCDSKSVTSSFKSLGIP